MSELKNKRYYVETWGCQMNEEDSETICGILESMGYLGVSEKEEADVIIFNTCCVRENPENKVYGNLGVLKGLKKKKKDLIICIGGCMMQQKGMPEKIKKKFPFVDIIFGTFNVHRLPELLRSVIENKKKIVEIWESPKDGIVEGMPVKRQNNLKAFVTIMHGCNNFCTYCIVPYTRGRERSRKLEDIIIEIKGLVKLGYREVTLLGQNVNSYGKDLEDMDFAKLLRAVNEVTGIERIRFMTSHPKDLTHELILAIKECDKVCKHVHLPVQSGSTRILKEMNRKYTKEEYLNLVDKLKNEIPDISMTTDIIVGFPGETEEDFKETLDIISKVRFDSAFTFIYSRRSGTPADMLKDQVPEEVKHERFNRLLELVNKIGEEQCLEYVGRVVEVLVEEVSKTDKERMTGRTDSGRLVHFLNGNEYLVGKIVKVKITEGQMYTLFGEFVEIVR